MEWGSEESGPTWLLHVPGDEGGFTAQTSRLALGFPFRR